MNDQMNDQWMDQLSEYLDESLSAPERAALEAHVAGCTACAATLDELRRVVARARALDDQPPGADLWPGIATHIGLARGSAAEAHDLAAPRLRSRRFSFTVPQLAAACVALVLLSGGTAWLLRSRTRTAWVSAPSLTAGGGLSAITTARFGAAADPRYAAAVADLERTLERGRGRLGTATVRVLEQNLQIIDKAIREAQNALAADPANMYLNLHLADQMRRKLELLQRANAIASARS